MTTSQQVQDMLQTARADFADAVDNPTLLKNALSEFHSALEEYFRWTLEQNNDVPFDRRLNLRNTKLTDWPALLDLMRQYGGLSAKDTDTIYRYNQIRNSLQHRNVTYKGGRQGVQQYANLVERLIDGTDPLDIPDDLFDANMAELGVSTSHSRANVARMPAGESIGERTPRRDASSATGNSASVPRNSASSGESTSQQYTPRQYTPRRNVTGSSDKQGSPIGVDVGDWFMYALIALIILASSGNCSGRR
jgi:hypothetical protein